VGTPLSISLNGLVGRRFDAVLFDLDGTLVDSTASVERAWLAWAAGRGIDRERLVGHHGIPTGQILAGLLPAGEVDAESVRLEAMEIADAVGITLLPGAGEALSAVPRHRAAIVTSCSAPLARARIEAADLAVPAVLVTAGDVALGKPDPAPYLLAAQRLGVPADRCLAVEDAPAGLISARAAGCATLSVRTTHAADDLDADAVVATLADVRFVAVPDGVRLTRP
jgi:mannitol-1-/sugar-/sorbitol-6-phosphatase